MISVNYIAALPVVPDLVQKFLSLKITRTKVPTFGIAGSVQV